MTFAAKYPGTCRQGQDDIRPGDEIERLDGGYAHVKCPPRPDAGMSRPPMKAAPAPELEPGMYRNQAGIFKVQRSRVSGGLYAKRLVIIRGERLTDANEVKNIEFEYAPGMVKAILPADRMTIDEATGFGIQYGFCCVCGRFLKDATSVAEGIGPVCGSRV